MKIRNLKISNFRGIKELNLDFTDANGNALDHIVLAGTNGSGKTSILEAILFVTGRFNLIPKPAKGLANNTFLGADSFQLTAIIEGAGKKVEYSIKDKQFTPTGKNVETGAADSVFSFSTVEYFPSWRAPKLIGSVSVTTGKKGRRPENTLENRLWNLKQYFVDLTARKGFSENDKQKNSFEKQEADAFMKLNNAWGILYPNRDEKFIAAIAGSQLLAGFDLYLTGRTASKIPVDSLSSGEIEALTMFGRYIMGNLRRGILLIDEPELHLHPAWQRKIIKALKEVLPNTQLIVATHSPQIISETPSENLFLLNKADGMSEVLRPSYSYGLDANRVLEELLGVAERPDAIKEELHLLFEQIGTNKLEDAKKTLARLKDELKEEPELIKADALIHRKELIGK